MILLSVDDVGSHQNHVTPDIIREIKIC